MFPSKVLMDKVFGNLAHVRGLLTYRLSPHELKPFAGAFSKGGPNMIPRTTSTIMTWLPVLITSVFIYVTVEKSHKKRQRKNPNDYLNEVDPNTLID
ncbi:unnamed protein product [Danaus chrysippus]|uniref:Cytochrome b-c1 complex subunit 8 n=1 Tax=Danaus chrysippus TaxID=151541 RepID=A0A8J2QID3_9NEOP|nr:unnamed protein product [Danaus chrysippus]